MTDFSDKERTAQSLKNADCIAKVTNVARGDRLTIRKQPHHTADVVSSYVSHYEGVKVLDYLENEWVKTNLGYVNGRYLECN